MPLFRLQDILELQNDTESIRNICILAHVDHGKIGEMTEVQKDKAP